MSTPRLRQGVPEDAEAIAAIYAPFVTNSAISFETEVPDADQIRTRLIEGSAIYPWLVAEDRGQLAGYAYASRHSARAAYQWSADLTVYLGEGYRGQGLGKQLYRGLFSLLQRQGFRSLYAGITLPNAASIALHKAMGMEEIGIYRKVGFKLAAWHDVIWFGLSFNDDQAPSGPPISFGALSHDDVDVLLSV